MEGNEKPMLLLKLKPNCQSNYLKMNKPCNTHKLETFQASSAMGNIDLFVEVFKFTISEYSKYALITYQCILSIPDDFFGLNLQNAFSISAIVMCKRKRIYDIFCICFTVVTIFIQLSISRRSNYQMSQFFFQYHWLLHR